MKIIDYVKLRKKYNTLLIRYEAKSDDLDHKTIQLNTEKRVKAKQQELYTEKIQELTNEIIEQKKKIAELKKEIKDLKREK